jgi:hypothetical protein
MIAIAHSNLEFMNKWHKYHRHNSHGPTVSCIPTGLLDIDLFSLDVEGAELTVLET